MKTFLIAPGTGSRIVGLICVLGTLLFSACKPPEKQVEQIYEAGLRDWQGGAQQVALGEFSRAIELDPKFAPAYMARAGARFELKDFAGAISDCNQDLSLEPDDERAFLIKGVSKFYLNDFSGAHNDLNTALSLNSDDFMAYVCRGSVLGKSRDWDGAQADFTKAIQINPNYAPAYTSRAAVEMMLKDYEKGVADASDAIELDSVNASDAYKDRAIGKCHLKDRAGALADANQAIELKPADVSGYLTRAMVEIIWDDYSSASNDLQTAFQFSPTNTEIYLHQGALEQKCGELDAAIADYNRGLAPDPQSFHAPEVYEALGFTWENLSQWRQAREEFRKSLAFNSPPHDIHFELFLIGCRLGETNQAQSELAAYIQSIPASKAGEWSTSVAHYLAGKLNESQLLAQANTTAKCSATIPSQICEAYYYAGMERLLAGDKPGAQARFQKSVDTGEDNVYQYKNARFELQALK